jgi:hypothetical protein
MADVDWALAEGVADGLDGVKSVPAVMLAQRLPKKLAAIAAERKTAADRVLADAYQEASIERQTAELIARRDAHPPVNEESVEDFMGSLNPPKP